MPDSSSVDPQPDSGSPPDLMESSKPGCEEEVEGLEELEGVELEEVRKLQELVRRLEVQNETLRNRGSKKIIQREACSSIGERLPISQVMLEHDGADFELSPPRDPFGGEAASCLPLVGTMSEEEEVCGDFGDLAYSNGGEQTGGDRQTPDSPSQGSYESETLAESDSGLDQTALDEVDVLNLEDECAEEEDEDSWYVIPAQHGFGLYTLKNRHNNFHTVLQSRQLHLSSRQKSLQLRVTSSLIFTFDDKACPSAGTSYILEDNLHLK